MCGLAGFFNLSDRSLRPDAEDIVARQIATLRYRGPDAAGAYLGPGVAFGHVRLSIIDVSDSANQPMLDATGQIAVMFNGEIYNFEEVRDQLMAKGHTFRTRSDTEVIVEGYAAWGVDVVHRLRGMFAIALFDRRQDRLVLIRDRVGKKPLHYAVVDGHLVFASEPKAILAFPGFTRRVSLEAVHEYLTFQYVPTPLSAFAGISKLPPAHLGVIERGKAVSTRRYYSLPSPENATARSPERLREELVDQLKEATRLRMISDVPLGAFLSGGVDSSAVVAMMALSSQNPVNTFTIGFDEAAFDERAYARQVADRYGTHHHEMNVRPDAMSVLPTLAYHYDEPFADPSAIPTYYVSKLAREKVTVILSGDGGDECFLGYTRYLACRGFDLAERLPNVMLRSLRSLALALPARVDNINYARRARRAMEVVFETPGRRYEQFIAHFTDRAKEGLYAGEMRQLLSRSVLDRLDAYFDAARTMAHGASWTDIHTYLPDDLLVKMDIASMANSLEVRAPFLDHKVMEWAATIPESQRFHGRHPKSLLKQAMEPYLPRALLYRPKMGFALPVDRWLRTDMRGFVRDLLLDSRARQRGLFDPKAVDALLDLSRPVEQRALRTWALVMLELWFRQWIDPADPFAATVPQDIMARRDGEVRLVA
jgi:asparagine synthase (glutamine-hydrolysing)